MLTPQQLAWLQGAARAAYGAELETGCPADFSLAQACLEGGWGRDCPGNNCFGIKAVTGQKSQLLKTREVVNGQSVTTMQPFAVYGSLQEAFEAHATLLTLGTPYRAAFERYQQDKDLDGFIVRVCARYETADRETGLAHPNPYLTEIMEILHKPEVQQALTAARQSAAA